MATTISPRRKRKKPSILKRIRETARRTQTNRIRKGRLRVQVKSFRRALASGDLEQARTLLRPTLSILDRCAHLGILHGNSAARTKSRLLVSFNALAAKQSSIRPAAS